MKRGNKMLKIKDNVDLKELEKFGFEPNVNRTNSELAVNFYEHGWEKIAVMKNRYIYLETEGKYYGAIIEDKAVDTLFDLIQTGLVEKVEK